MPYDATWLTPNTLVSDEWVVVTTDGSGIITAIDQYNNYSGLCP